MKKVSYMSLLKEAIQEYDAKAMDYRGPMTDPALTFDGDGELETHKDASSILERYYFNEKSEKLVEQDEEVGPDVEMNFDEDEDAEDPNEIVTGEEPDDVDETMDDLEDEILDEDLELEDYDPEDPDIVAKEEPLIGDVSEDLELEDYDPEDSDIVAKEEPLSDEDAKPMNNEMLALENAVIEKLIQEMEETTPADDIEHPAEDGDDAAGPQAGTDAATEDEVNKIIEDFDLLEAELDSDDESDDKELDIDKEIGDEDSDSEKKVVPEGEGMGPIRVRAARELEEAFKIFKEDIDEIEDDNKEKEDKDESDEVSEDLELEDLELEEDEIGDEEKEEDEKDED